MIEWAVEDEAVKNVQFNGKDSYRIIAKDVITILAPDTQSTELESSDCILETECRQIINETAVENPTPNTEAVEKLFKDFVKSVENRLLAIEDSSEQIRMSSQWKIARKKKQFVSKS